MPSTVEVKNEMVPACLRGEAVFKPQNPQPVCGSCSVLTTDELRGGSLFIFILSF